MALFVPTSKSSCVPAISQATPTIAPTVTCGGNLTPTCRDTLQNGDESRAHLAQDLSKRQPASDRCGVTTATGSGGVDAFSLIACREHFSQIVSAGPNLKKYCSTAK
eukprot:6202799-Pleurochrysis_carterae.AAC.1